MERVNYYINENAIVDENVRIGEKQKFGISHTFSQVLL